MNRLVWGFVILIALKGTPGMAQEICFWDITATNVCTTAFGETTCWNEDFYDLVGCSEPDDAPDPPGPDGVTMVNGGVTNPRDLNNDGVNDCYKNMVNSTRVTASPLGVTRNLGSRYGGPNDGFRYNHKGSDVRGFAGDPVFSTQGGTVARTLTGQGNRKIDGVSDLNGNHVRINYDDGTQGVFLHFDNVLVNRHDRVEMGQQIGTVGNTGHSCGAHLHYTHYDSFGGFINPETDQGNCN